MAVEYVGSRAAAARARRRERVEVDSFARRLDWLLLLAVAGLVGYGLWAIAGITRHDVPGNANYYVVRQGVAAAAGVAGFLALLLVDPSTYRRYWRQLYAATAGIMVLVFLAGEVARGSKRWIDLGFFRFQPSEFGKLVFVLALAGFLAERGRRVSQTSTLLSAIGLGLAPIVLVFLQPDIGTAMVYTAALGALLFVAGCRWLHLSLIAAVTVVGAVAVLWLLPAAGFQVLKPYQQDRIVGFTHPESDPRGSTWNVNQSITAVGAGGLDGRGVEGATQTRLNYLPEHATDFAFASLAEQRGFFGVAALLLLYLLVIWRGLKAITGARDLFSAVAAGGIVVALLFQIFVNVGMTIGIAPVTGIPLPFVSVGGSSMVANLLAVGVLQAIYARGAGSYRRR